MRKNKDRCYLLTDAEVALGAISIDWSRRTYRLDGLDGGPSLTPEQVEEIFRQRGAGVYVDALVYYHSNGQLAAYAPPAFKQLMYCRADDPRANDHFSQEDAHGASRSTR